MINANEVLKCFDGPAKTVSPGARPPSVEPDKATLIIGISVGTISFSVKNLESDNTSVNWTLLFFFNLSIIDI